MKQFLAVIAGMLAMWAGGVAAQQLSNSGKEFWVAYGHHQFMEQGNTNGQEMVLYLSAGDQPATVKVGINGTSWTKTYHIAANSVLASDNMPKNNGGEDARLYTRSSSFGGTNSEGVFNKGIHIESNVPIVAYAHIYGSRSSGATMLMPVETWGFNYTSLNFKQFFNTDCFSWLYVIASHDNTKVQFTTTTPTRGGKGAGETFNVVLNKGQVYQLLGAGVASPVGSGYDITGTTVKVIPNDAGECYRIAAFSGSSRTRINIGDCVPLGGDNLIQQIFPSQAWGKRYLTAPTSRSDGAGFLMNNYYRILVDDPATEVRVNGAVLSPLINGRYYEYTSSSADYITADKPIMVAQYIPSTGCSGSLLGDEEMIYISPIEQAIKRVGCYRNTKESIEVNYLTLIIPTKGIASLKIDGSAGYDYTYLHPALPGYSVVVKRWNAAQAQVTVSSDSAFTGITYGLGGTESYGYNAGTLLNNLRGTGEIKNQYQTGVRVSEYTCRKTPFIASLLISYKPTRLLWAMSEAPAMQPRTDVMEVMPVPVDSQKVGNLWYYRYILQQPLLFTDTGSQVIPVYSTHPEIENCNHTEVINIPVKVNAGASSDFTYSNSRQTAWFAGCRLDSVYFKPVTRAASYRWSFSAAIADTSLLEAPSKYYPAQGIYPVHLQAIQADGCVADTTKNIQIYPPPVAGIALANASVCVQSAVTVTNTATYAGDTKPQAFFWEMGDGRTGTNTATSFTVNYNKAGEFKIQQVAKISDRCISDTATAIVKVYARPVAAFEFSKGCLGADGVATFTNTSTLEDVQTMTYLWNFGDPASGTANTAATRNAQHAYGSYKAYSISLQVTTEQGCVDDTAITTTFALKPVLVFDDPGTVCNTQKAVALNKARVTNGVPGTGIYKGNAITAAGVFNAAVAGAGTHEIWYVFQTQGDCRDSVSRSVKVEAAPVAGFTVKKDTLCLGETFEFTDNSTGVSLAGREWIWGDGATSGGTAPRKTYRWAGVYRVALVVTDAGGCRSDTAFRPVVLYPKPGVDAGPSFMAEEGTRITFAASVDDPAAKLLWTPVNTGLSNAGILRPSLVVTNDQTYTLTAINAGNCSASDTLTVRVVRPLVIPNIFTPNGDGVNDAWVITHLSDYAAATVQVFSRYGSRVWQQSGARPWDGTWQGRPVPSGTYYYIIDLKNGAKPLSGSITLVR